jgi:signal transduction histidine kinase
MLIVCKFIHDLYGCNIYGVIYTYSSKSKFSSKWSGLIYWSGCNAGLILWMLIVIISFTIIIIYNYKRLVHQKRIYQEVQLANQRNLLVAIIESEEKERKRIGMDLHDEVGSLLSLLRLLIENIYTNLNESYVEQCKSIIDKIVNNVRSITYNLSPFVNEAYHFSDALEDLCDSVNQLKTIRIVLDDHTDGKLDLIKDNTSLSLFRVLSELVNNTIKHSKASRINLKLLLNHDLLVIDYEDNGIGIHETAERKKGSGMLNIESRLSAIGADFYHRSKAGAGFNMTIKVNI